MTDIVEVGIAGPQGPPGTNPANALLETGGSMTGPLVTQLPNIVFDGDSLTNGTGSLPFNNFPASNDYPSQVACALDYRGTYYNVGVGGETTTTMIANAPTVVDVKLVSGSNNVVCFHGGTNDLISNDNATTTYNLIKQYCLARKAAGWKVVVGTLTPRSDVSAPADFDTQRLAVNTSIRTNWQTFADAIADIGADANMGTVGQERGTYYYNGDLVHHTPNGYQILAGYFLDALKTLGITGHSHFDRQSLISDLYIPATSFSLVNGTPTLSFVGITPSWNLNHASTDAVCTTVLVPREWKTFAANFMWTQNSGGSGNVAFRLDTGEISTGNPLASATITGTQINQAVPSSSVAASLVTMNTVTNQNLVNQGGAPRVMKSFRVVRLGTSGSDTYTSAANFLGMYLFRVL